MSEATLAKAARETTSPINQASVRLNNVYGAVEEAVAILEERLANVLSPVAGLQGDNGQDRPPLSNLASFLETEADRGVALNTRIRSIVDRIEL